MNIVELWHIVVLAFNLFLWYVLINNYLEEDSKEVSIYMEKNESMNNAKDKLDKMSENERKRCRYRLYYWNNRIIRRNIEIVSKETKIDE